MKPFFNDQYYKQFAFTRNRKFNSLKDVLDANDQVADTNFKKWAGSFLEHLVGLATKHQLEAKTKIASATLYYAIRSEYYYNKVINFT